MAPSRSDAPQHTAHKGGGEGGACGEGVTSYRVEGGRVAQNLVGVGGSVQKWQHQTKLAVWRLRETTEHSDEVAVIANRLGSLPEKKNKILHMHLRYIKNKSKDTKLVSNLHLVNWQTI